MNIKTHRFMNTVKWILQVIIALAFLTGASYRLFTPYEELMVTEGTYWVEDLSSTQVKVISILEILGAIGVILPMFVSRFKYFVPLAAIGLALTMIGASTLHLMRGEPVIVNVVIFLICGAIAYFRWDLMKMPGSKSEHLT